MADTKELTPAQKRKAARAKQNSAPTKTKTAPKAKPSVKSKKQQPKKKAVIGRPSGFTEDIANEICQRVAEAESVRKICLDKHMPSMSMIMRWLVASDKEGAEQRLIDFREQYTRAQGMKADTLVEQIAEIHEKAWTPLVIKDKLIKDKSGAPVMVVDRSSAAAAKLEADNKKWLAEKLAPKKYGNRQNVDLTSGGKPVKHEWHVHPVVSIGRDGKD